MHGPMNVKQVNLTSKGAHLGSCWDKSTAPVHESLVHPSNTQESPSQQVPIHHVDPSNQLLSTSLALHHLQFLHFL